MISSHAKSGRGAPCLSKQKSAAAPSITRRCASHSTMRPGAIITAIVTGHRPGHLEVSPGA